MLNIFDYLKTTSKSCDMTLRPCMWILIPCNKKRYIFSLQVILHGQQVLLVCRSCYLSVSHFMQNIFLVISSYKVPFAWSTGPEQILLHGLKFLFHDLQVLFNGLQVVLPDTQVSLALFYGLQVK